MIIDKQKKGNVTVYYIDKDYDDDHMRKTINKKLKPSDIHFIINDDADVYAKDGQLLLKFRKNKLNKTNTTEFYDNVIDFAVIPTSNRGSASGSKSKNVRDNPLIMTNIIGFFDRLSPKQKFILKQQGKKISTSVRQCRFNMDYPDKYKKLLPLIRQINEYYKQYVPDKYKAQRRKANQTPFKNDTIHILY